MESLLDHVLYWSETLAGHIWWPAVIFMLGATGIYMSFLTKFIQIRRLGLAIKFMLRGRTQSDAQGDITPFQALMTALAATVGNGNIAGVATAIASGGPGAPFWMWMTAVFGMATKYAEALLGLKFRQKMPDGTFSGGTMYFLRDALKYKKLGKVLAFWFSIAVILMATFGSGNMAQANSIALSLNSDFNISFVITGLVLALMCGIVLLGGVTRIATVSDKLVPFMIVLYMGGAIYVIGTHYDVIFDVFGLMIVCAFTPEAVAGGVIGHTVKDAMRFGISRGTLSNESGVGSCSIPAAAARGNEAAAQGMVAMMGTFIDTIIVCSMTAFVIISSGLHTTGMTSTELSKSAFATGLGSTWGGYMVSISSFLFGFTTLIGWSYYGEQGARFMFGQKSVKPYRLIFCAFVFFGAVLQGKYLQIVWNFADIGNALMAIPNLIGLVLLGKIVKDVTDDYLRRWDSGLLKSPFGD